MFFFCVFALFCVQSIWSISLREQLYELTEDFKHAAKPTVNIEFPQASQPYYTSLQYYLEGYYEDSQGSGNFSGFGQTWFVGNANLTRSQYVVYLNGNDTGYPFEVVVEDYVQEYVIYQKGHDAMCMYTNTTATPNYVYNYIGSRFITPDFEEYGVLWGPRLVNFMTSASGPYITVMAGTDSFNAELVLFRYHYHSSTQYLEYIIYVHDVNHGPFSVESQLEVPVTVQCLDELSEDGLYAAIASVPFPQILV